MGYSVNQFDFNRDEDGLCSLWKQVLKNPDNMRFISMYTDNSYGIPASWLIFHDQGAKPVGSVSVFPRMFNIMGSETKIGINFDIITLKQHRTLGPAIMLLKTLARECGEQGYKALIAMPNKKSQPVFKRAGYEKLGTAWRWSKILRSESELPPVIENAHIRKVAGYLIDILLRWISFGTWIKLCNLRYWSKYHTSKVAIGDLIVPDYPHESIMPYSSSGYLKWRYAGVARNKPEAFVLTNEQGQALAYIIYHIENNEAVLESIYSSGSKRILCLILSKFIKSMYSQRISSIQVLYHGTGMMLDTLKKLGFVKREGHDVFLNTLDRSLEKLAGALREVPLYHGDLDL